jgi:hypothetical protein
MQRRLALVTFLSLGGCAIEDRNLTLVADSGPSTDASVDAGVDSASKDASRGMLDGQPQLADAGDVDLVDANGVPTDATGMGATDAGSVSCSAIQKRCAGQCVSLDDPAYGCSATSCDSSTCPAANGGTLACKTGACVIGTCAADQKKCGDKCVSLNDPTYGCGPTTCDATACPAAGGGTVVCQGTSCVIGSCPAATKACNSKCVPTDVNNGCADPAHCTACAASETCAGTPLTQCKCVPNDAAACAGKACGSAINNCGQTIMCTNTCPTAGANLKCDTATGSCVDICTGGGAGTASHCCDNLGCGLCQKCVSHTCQNQTSSEDLKDDCSASAAATCGNDGFCNGSGACKKWSANTPCQVAGCSGGSFTAARQCDGSGTCTPATPKTCAPYACTGTGCAISCSLDSDCTGTYCDAPFCKPQLIPGSTCARPEQCTSSLCGGRCCNPGAPCKCTQPSPMNVAANAGLDKNLSSWASQDGRSWDSEDAEGCPFSGSLNDTADEGYRLVCVPALPVTAYNVGAWVKMSDNTTLDFCQVQFFEHPGCDTANDPVLGYKVFNINPALRGWILTSTSVQSPVNTGSASVGCGGANFKIDKIFVTQAPGMY